MPLIYIICVWHALRLSGWYNAMQTDINGSMSLQVFQIFYQRQEFTKMFQQCGNIAVSNVEG